MSTRMIVTASVVIMCVSRTAGTLSGQSTADKVRSFSDYYAAYPAVSRARDTKRAPLADAILETLLSPAVPLAIKAAAIEVRTFPEGATANDVTDLRRALSEKYGDILARSNREKASAEDLFVLGYLERQRYSDQQAQEDGLQLLALAAEKSPRSASIGLLLGYETARAAINTGWCVAYRKFEPVERKVQDKWFNADLNPDAVAWFIAAMAPYEAQCLKHDRILADFQSYELEEKEIETDSARRHDVAGLLLRARELAERGTTVACEGELDRLQAAATLKGISFAPGAECIHFELKYDWFQRMASEHGTPGDVDFVRLYRRTYPGSEVFAFEDWVSDYGACARYGSGAIGDLYLAWRAHALRYPGAHPLAIKQRMDRLLAFLAPELKACTCNDSVEGIVSELEHFLATAPHGSDAARVRRALATLKSDPDTASDYWELSCVPG